MHGLKPGQGWVKITQGSLNSDMHESLKSTFSLIQFAYNLMIGYSKNNRSNPEGCFPF